MQDEINISTLSDEQINYLSSLHFINQIDSHLRVISSVRIIPLADPILHRVVLSLECLYDNERVDTLSFDLHNYGFDDIVELARNIRSNEYILQAVDNSLAGDIE